MNVTEPWCIAQDMRPFLLMPHSQHRTRDGALRAWGGNPYTRVMETADVHDINRRLTEDKAYFEATLKLVSGAGKTGGSAGA